MTRGSIFRKRPTRGFTLVELLVVLGILALMISMLLPAMTATRRAAERTVCLSQLRELIRASHMHLSANRRFPDPLHMPAAGASMPASVQTRLLTDVAKQLLLPDPANATSIDQLPPVLVCPVRRKLAFNTSIDASLGVPIWQTGYMYLGALEAKPTNGVLLQPQRHARQRGGSRGALWADTLTVQSYGPSVVGYGYFHATGPVEFDPNTRVTKSRAALDGQHVGYSDGSVEWRLGKNIQFDPAHPDADAAYKVNVGPSFIVRYFY